MLNLKYSKLLRINGGGLRYEPLPDCIGPLNTSKRYEESMRELARFKSSSLIPYKVRESLEKLDTAATGNKDLLMDVLNEKFVQNPDNLVYEENPVTPYFGVTSAAYWERFTPLKPIVDDVLAKASAYLGTDK